MGWVKNTPREKVSACLTPSQQLLQEKLGSSSNKVEGRFAGVTQLKQSTLMKQSTELLDLFLTLSLYRLCFRLVSFTWCLYPWASAYSEETHQTGTPLLGWYNLCWVCSLVECNLCFTVNPLWWENLVDQNAVKFACSRFSFSTSCSTPSANSVH